MMLESPASVSKKFMSFFLKQIEGNGVANELSASPQFASKKQHLNGKY